MLEERNFTANTNKPKKKNIKSLKEKTEIIFSKNRKWIKYY